MFNFFGCVPIKGHGRAIRSLDFDSATSGFEKCHYALSDGLDDRCDAFTTHRHDDGSDRTYSLQTLASDRRSPYSDKGTQMTQARLFYLLLKGFLKLVGGF